MDRREYLSLGSVGVVSVLTGCTSESDDSDGSNGRRDDDRSVSDDSADSTTDDEESSSGSHDDSSNGERDADGTEDEEGTTDTTEGTTETGEIEEREPNDVTEKYSNSDIIETPEEQLRLPITALPDADWEARANGIVFGSGVNYRPPEGFPAVETAAVVIESPQEMEIEYTDLYNSFVNPDIEFTELDLAEDSFGVVFEEGDVTFASVVFKHVNSVGILSIAEREGVSDPSVDLRATLDEALELARVQYQQWP